ncbi:MAG: hypothetical protein LBG09_03190 [Puniceicoccales bacterium]|jgi:hypothetical protein|nr:hypothetical protein [Puniceicoccales bacterium]
MIHKKQFAHLPYGLKKRSVERFFLLYFLEFLLNLWGGRWYVRITFMPFLWLTFTKKHFHFYGGCGLFVVGFLWYYRAYPFSGLALGAVAIFLFCLFREIDVGRMTSPLAFFAQVAIFTFFDPVFDKISLLTSTSLTIFTLYLLPSDFVPSGKRRVKKFL